MKISFCIVWLSLWALLKCYGQDVVSINAITIPLAGTTTYVVPAGQIVNITSNKSVTLNPGTALMGTSIIGINNTYLITPPLSNPSADLDKNWTAVVAYDDNGNIIAQSKNFFDNNGKATQSQTKDQTTGHVLATQNLYDFQGRSVLTSLAAPINNSDFAYKDKFITNVSTDNYDYRNFDGDPNNNGMMYARINSPDAVDNTQIGTLGWYYSNNNTIEPYVATTSFPYSRIDYFNDGTVTPKRTSGIGDALVMGSNRENTTNGFPVVNELDNYLRIRNQFFPSTVVGSSPTNMAGNALQNISTNADGLQAVSITDLAGKELMNGRVDITANSWLTVNNTVQLNQVQPIYSFTLRSQGVLQMGGQDNPLDDGITDFSVSSNYPVTVTRAGVVIFPVIPNDIGNNFVHQKDAVTANGYEYVVTSSYPFYITAYNKSGIVNDGTVAKVTESDISSIHYFQITKATLIIITGSYKLYEMKGETDITSTFNGNSLLNPGFYKVIALTGEVTISYSNSFSDISYNYYNQLGQLIASITPNGVKKLIDAVISNTLSSITFPPFTTKYEYDVQGRLVASTSPDGGRSEFVYRKDGKIRFSQNAVQRAANNNYTEKFSYTNYDDIGRAIESGEYVIPNGAVATFQSLKTNDVLLENVDPLNDLLPVGIKQDWVRTHYDIADNSYGIGGYVQEESFLKGVISWTENANSKTWYNYNDQGKLIWMIKYLNGLGYKTLDYTYNYLGDVIQIAYQKNNPTESFYHYYSYDANQRLANVQTSRDGINKLQQANYRYYLHGPLKRMELGDQLQGVDYVYTIQGMLKSINHASGDPTKDPGHDGQNTFAQDAFGMQLEYFPGDYVRSYSNIGSINTGEQPYYTGNVNGLVWQSKKPQSVVSTLGINMQNPTMYKYIYDNKNQLKGANWGTPNFANNSFVAANSFSETVSGYDPNGNITGISRTNNTGSIVDNFTNYQYEPGTNKLNTVGGTASPSSYGTYTYNELGQLTSVIMPGNAAASGETARTFYLKYDVTGKITAIYGNPNLVDDLKVSYGYDEMGRRISRTDQTGSSYSVYDSQGNNLAIYSGSNLTEVPIYGSSRLGIYTFAGNGYEYELRDNVGSIRVVINRNKNSNGQADVVTYNDYYPFGSIAQSGGTGYRYDYQGAYAEKDPVTGFNNFELRMYDGKIGRWLSVDPKNIGYTPYNGMDNNPTSTIDKDGGAPPDDYQVDVQGNISLIKITQDKVDLLYSSNNDGSIDKNNFLVVNKGILNNIKQSTTFDTHRKFEYMNIGTDQGGDKMATDLFEFLANQTMVEWAQIKYGINSDYISTTHERAFEIGGSTLAYQALKNKIAVREDIHDHPWHKFGSRALLGVSGFDPDDYHTQEGTGDKASATYFSKINKNQKFAVFDVSTQVYYIYNSTAILGIRPR